MSSIISSLLASTAQSLLPSFSQPPDLSALANSKLQFQISPIVLVGGIATGQSGGSMPIMSLTPNNNEDADDSTLEYYFASYMPLAGATMVNNQVATYPFANQSVAANAIIAQPLNISMLMLVPASPATGGYAQKLTTMMALQASLQQHNLLGGLYNIVTNSFIYTNCIMTGMRDASGGQSRQVQYAWQLDFVQPLVTIEAAQTAQNNLMQKLSDGTAISGTPSWTPNLGGASAGP